MASHADQYQGDHLGRAARAHTKITRGVRSITLDRLEELLGKDPTVTEPPPAKWDQRWARRK